MILGMSEATFTMLHVAISLVGIVTGVIVLMDLLDGRRRAGWTAVFLATTILTSLTGFLFPRDRVLPSHVVGVLSLVVLAVACWALYGRRLAGAWRAWYVVTALLALYLNVFVAVVQAFQKVPAVRRLAPTQSEGPFLVAQLAVLALFAVLAVRALRRFRPVPAG